jgi:hypothetical protein
MENLDFQQARKYYSCVLNDVEAQFAEMRRACLALFDPPGSNTFSQLFFFANLDA